MIRRFLACTGGATAIEYSMIAAIVSIIIIVACTNIGNQLNAMFYGRLLSAFK